MTIRISLKAVAFAVYTLALLAGASGMSYAVFEWRDDSPAKAEVSDLGGRIDSLEGSVHSLSDRIGNLSTEVSAVSDHSHDDCGDAIVSYVVDYNARYWLIGLGLEAEADAQLPLERVNQQAEKMREACR